MIIGVLTLNTVLRTTFTLYRVQMFRNRWKELKELTYRMCGFAARYIAVTGKSTLVMSKCTCLTKRITNCRVHSLIIRVMSFEVRYCCIKSRCHFIFLRIRQWQCNFRIMLLSIYGFTINVVLVNSVS